MSGGWAGRRPGVAGRARLRLVGARCGWVWSGVGGRVGWARPGDPSLVAGGGVVAAGKWGELQHYGCDTPATRRSGESNGVKPPVERAGERWLGGQTTGRGRAWGGWAIAGGSWAQGALLPALAAGCGPVIRRWWWAGAPTLGIGGLRADRGRDASDARDASKARHAQDASDARDASKARHANNARSAAGVRR